MRFVYSVLIGSMLLAGGCYQAEVHNSWDDFSKGQVGSWVDRRIDAPPRRQGDRDKDPYDWAILIESFEGDDAEMKARALHGRLVSDAYVPDVWLKEWGPRWLVLRGRYESPAEREAQQALRQMRMIVLGVERPFESANMTRLSTMNQPGSLNVSQYQGQFPYTLQIAAYEQGYRGDRRKTAEQHARKLRKQGHQAYYLHGPNMSMVTVSLFTDQDRVPRTMSMGGREVTQFYYGPRIRELQEQFPHNLVNGEIFHLPTARGGTGSQKSTLIAIR